MTLPLTHEGYERLRDSALDPRSLEGGAALAAQARFFINDIDEVGMHDGAMPEDDILRALAGPRIDTVKNMLYPLDGLASPILRFHEEFQPERLDTEVNAQLEQDKQKADRYHVRSSIVAAIALRQTMYGLPDLSINPSRVIDEPLDLDATVKTEYGPRWNTARLANLYETKPYILLDRTQEESIALRASRHYYALPIVSFSYKALQRVRESVHYVDSAHQLVA